MFQLFKLLHFHNNFIWNACKSLWHLHHLCLITPYATECHHNHDWSLSTPQHILCNCIMYLWTVIILFSTYITGWCIRKLTTCCIVKIIQHTVRNYMTDLFQIKLLSRLALCLSVQIFIYCPIIALLLHNEESYYKVLSMSPCI